MQRGLPRRPQSDPCRASPLRREAPRRGPESFLSPSRRNPPRRQMPLRVSILASQGIPLVPRYPWFFVPLRPDPCPPKTRADLEWDHLLSAIADRCAGALGRQRAASLSFALTREEAASWQEEAVEARSEEHTSELQA